MPSVEVERCSSFFLQVIAQTDVNLLHRDDRRTNGACRIVVEANQVDYVGVVTFDP